MPLSYAPTGIRNLGSEIESFTEAVIFFGDTWAEAREKARTRAVEEEKDPERQKLWAHPLTAGAFMDPERQKLVHDLLRMENASGRGDAGRVAGHIALEIVDGLTEGEEGAVCSSAFDDIGLIARMVAVNGVLSTGEICSLWRCRLYSQAMWSVWKNGFALFGHFNGKLHVYCKGANFGPEEQVHTTEEPKPRLLPLF